MDRSWQLCQAPVGSLWHRCYKCPASAELRRGFCQDFVRPGHMAGPHAAFGSCRNALDTTHAGGPLVRSGRSQAHQALARRLGGASRERRARHARFQRRLPQARAHEATGTWGLGTGCAERRKEGHGEAARPAPWRPPEHHSGGECRFLVVLAARQCGRRRFPHGLPERALLLDGRPGVQHQRAVHLRVDLETDLGAHRRDRKGHATMQHVRAGTASLWHLQANELVDEQAQKAPALHPNAARVQSCSARDSFLGWLAKFQGRLRAHVKFRGWSDLAPRVQRQRGTLSGKLAVIRREPRRNQSDTRKISRTHTLAKTGNCWFCWRCGFCTAQRGKGLAGRCRGVMQSRSGALWKLKDGRNPKDGRSGGANLGPGGRGPGGDGSWMGLVRGRV